MSGGRNEGRTALWEERETRQKIISQQSGSGIGKVRIQGLGCQTKIKVLTW